MIGRALAIVGGAVILWVAWSWARLQYERAEEHDR